MLRRRPSQVPLGASGEARRALLGATSPSSSPSSASKISSARRRKLALAVALAAASAILFGVGVVLGAAGNGGGGGAGGGSISASARSLLKAVVSRPFSLANEESNGRGVFNDISRTSRRRPSSVPRRAGVGTGIGNDGVVVDDDNDDVDGPIEAYLVVYSHVDPGWYGCFFFLFISRSYALWLLLRAANEMRHTAGSGEWIGRQKENSRDDVFFFRIFLFDNDNFLLLFFLPHSKNTPRPPPKKKSSGS